MPQLLSVPKMALTQPSTLPSGGASRALTAEEKQRLLRRKIVSLTGSVLVALSAVLLGGEVVLGALLRGVSSSAARAADRPVHDPGPALRRTRRAVDSRADGIAAMLRELRAEVRSSRSELAALRRYVEAVAEEQARLRARLDRSGVPDEVGEVEESG